MVAAVLEPIILYITAYMAYLCAEMFHWSGIIAIITCGIAQAQYTFENIGSKSCVTTKFSSEVVA